MSKRVQRYCFAETYFYTYDYTSYYMTPNKKPKIIIAILQNKIWIGYHIPHVDCIGSPWKDI